MGADLSYGEVATSQHGLSLYLHTVKGMEAHHGAESTRPQYFAENSVSKTFSEVSMLQLTENTTKTRPLQDQPRSIPSNLFSWLSPDPAIAPLLPTFPPFLCLSSKSVVS